MNKKFIFVFFLAIFTFLHSAVLLDYYHRDYQVANRSVLVFDKKPEFNISKNENHIIIKVQNGKKDYDVESLQTPKNHLLKAITYSQKDNDLLIDFELHTFKGIVPVFDKMEFSENKNKYKVVMDFIITQSPENEEEALALAKFYKLTGRSKKAENILSAFENRKIETPKQVIKEKPEIVEEKPEIAKEKQITKPVKTPDVQTTKKTKPKPGFLSVFQVLPLYSYLLVILGIILIILTIRILLRKRKITSHIADKNQFSVGGFGTENMQIIAANKLAEYGWSNENIAKELYLTPQKVKELLKEIKDK